MISVRANALIGSDLEFTEDVCIKIDEQGIIIDISKEQESADYILPSSYCLFPGFINAHTHVGDAFLKDHMFGVSLEEAVGPTGLKHRKLQSSTIREQSDSIRNSLDILTKNGFTTFVDFRENGLNGIQLLKKELIGYPIRGIILGRPYMTERIESILDECDGLGLSDTFSLTQELADQVNNLCDKYSQKLYAIHVSESENVLERSFSNYKMSDIERSLNLLNLDYVVHATYSDNKDISLLSNNKVGIVSCPQSNAYYGLRFPPLEKFLKNKLVLSLGSDNIFCCNPNPFRMMAYTLYNARANNQQLSPKDVLKALTVNPGLIVRRKIGQIEVGFSGDLIGIDLSNPNLKYSKNVYTAITMRADTTNIDFHMFKGKVIKWIDQKLL